jgi:rSAM/selenodomain-associated transferase 2/rSAM/selenodomain-associated transferase 1
MVLLPQTAGRTGSGRVDSACAGLWHVLEPLQRAAARARRGRERLIVFTRYPEPGRAKTRMVPVLGERGAADLQRRMTVRAMQTVGALAARRPCEIEVCFEGGTARSMRDWLGPDVAFRPQGAGGLGERMVRASARSFAGGCDRVVIVGSDCPGISADLLAGAFDALREAPVVIGPASDGGYYLIGLRLPLPVLFDEVAWGSDRVLDQTLQRAEYAGVRVVLLGELADVDRPEDMPVWDGALAADSAEGGARPVSVIVPSLNEERYIGATLATLARGRDVEVIVADGGSEDGTVEIARAAGARIVAAARGRALQANAGAEAASGDLLLFVHADTRLPWGYDDAVRHAMADQRNAAGAFRFCIDGPGAALRIIEAVTNVRSRRLQMPYGDQGLFMRASVFDRLGGFRPLPVMEDFELVRRLRNEGRIVTFFSPAPTSERIWRRLGPWRTTAVHQVMIAGYTLGVPLERLAAWYAGWR